MRFAASTFFLPILALAQTPQAFEVASIKPNASSDNRVMVRMQPGGRFNATGIPVRFLIGQAYNVRDFQITGGPGWISSERYDVNAKAPDGLGERITPEMLRPMMKNLLEERFQLKAHTEKREGQIYSLVQSKDGNKMKASPDGGGSQQNMMRIGRGMINSSRVNMKAFALQLSQILGRNVTDNTGLDGFFDIDLEYSPEPGQGGGGPVPPSGPPPPGALPPADNSAPSIFTALQEKLGLRLESTKGPIDFVVIDSISKPTEN